jgi:hypothetical protein
MRRSTLLASAIAAMVGFFCLKEPLNAEEGGGGDYVPGTYASLLNITPNVPGLAVGTSFLYYGGASPAAKRCRLAAYWLPI